MGAPIGNQNARKAKDWETAIRKALARKHSTVDEGLEHLAAKLIDAVENGEGWAIKEIGDRFDGKPAQQVTVSGDPDQPLVTRIEREIVNTPNKDG